MVVVRVTLGLFLFGLFVVGSYVLLFGAYLHFDSDDSDPFLMVVGRATWLSYLISLSLLWGLSAVAMLWPGQKSDRCRCVLRWGGIWAGVSGAVSMGIAYIEDYERFYVEMAGLVLFSSLAIGLGLRWLFRKTAT